MPREESSFEEIFRSDLSLHKEYEDSATRRPSKEARETSGEHGSLSFHLLNSRMDHRFDKVLLKSSVESELVNNVRAGLAAGNVPVKADSGLLGAFFLKDRNGKFAGVFKRKKIKQETTRPGNLKFTFQDVKRFREGIPNEEIPPREVAAFILASWIIPETLYVKVHSECLLDSEEVVTRDRSRTSEYPRPRLSKFLGTSRESFDGGSLQQFVHNTESCADMGSSLFDGNEVEEIAMFDIRVLNTDRHEGNLLVQMDRNTLIPIDHGLIMPEYDRIDNEIVFCWSGWKQASQPFSDDLKERIRSLDAKKDIQRLKSQLGDRISEKGYMSLLVGEMLLKVAVLEFNRSPGCIASFCCRDLRKSVADEEGNLNRSGLNQSILKANSSGDLDLTILEKEFCKAFA